MEVNVLSNVLNVFYPGRDKCTSTMHFNIQTNERQKLNKYWTVDRYNRQRTSCMWRRWISESTINNNKLQVEFQI